MLHRVATSNGRFTHSEIETAIRFLLDRGADPGIRDEVYHSTSIGWACHFGQSDRVDLLIDRAGPHDAVGCDRPDRLRTLLAHDPGLANARGRGDGATPLHRLHGALTHGTEMIRSASAAPRRRERPRPAWRHGPCPGHGIGLPLDLADRLRSGWEPIDRPVDS